jgi:hypothetical protein
MRHGVRSVEGTINGELSPGTWKDFIAAAVRKAFAATTAITSLSITIAGAGPTYTVTRASGSFLTDGVKAGDVVRLTAGSFNAANLNKNLWVLSLETRPGAHRDAAQRRGAGRRGPDRRVHAVTGARQENLRAGHGHTDNSFASSTGIPTSRCPSSSLGCKVRKARRLLPPTAWRPSARLPRQGRDHRRTSGSTSPRRRPRPRPASARRGQRPPRVARLGGGAAHRARSSRSTAT